MGYRVSMTSEMEAGPNEPGQLKPKIPGYPLACLEDCAVFQGATVGVHGIEWQGRWMEACWAAQRREPQMLSPMPSAALLILQH